MFASADVVIVPAPVTTALSVRPRNTSVPEVFAVELTLSDPPLPVAFANAYWPFAVVAVADAVALPRTVLLPLNPPVAFAVARAFEPYASPVAVETEVDCALPPAPAVVPDPPVPPSAIVPA